MISVDALESFLNTYKRKRPHFNVAPRYSPGSPALVNRYLALGVAADEEGMYQHAKVGRYGADWQRKAQDLGLSGIVEVRAETNKGWEVLDLVTGDRFLRPFKKVT